LRFGALQMAIYTLDMQPFHIEGLPAFELEPPR